MTEKHWPARETMKIAAESHKCAKAGDRIGCIPFHVDLLKEHMKYMIPFSERWNRASATIKNIEAQL